jgi:hypothetical protein
MALPWRTQAPAGAMLGSTKIGGRWISAAQARQGVVGTASVASRIPQIVSGLQIRANAASASAAEEVLEDAQQNLRTWEPTMPNWTGELHDSGYVFHGSITNEYFVVFEAEHAPYVEFGSVHNRPPKPYLIPAVERQRPEYIARMAAMLQGL